MVANSSVAKVLLVAGTHGNERNAPWLHRHWQQHPGELQKQGLEVVSLIGNPAAYLQNKRYVNRDLNRSFSSNLLDDPENQELELLRARELLVMHGPKGSAPAQVVIDVHSTTAAMGSCLVIYGDREADLAIAAACQGALGLPVYLHGFDAKQNGFMIQAWPCGVVLEVGPVPQGVICPKICKQTRIAINTLLDVLTSARAGKLNLPKFLNVHRHLFSLEIPKDVAGNPLACLHPDRLKGDWQEIKTGDPLFLDAAGKVEYFKSSQTEPVYTVFSNEAAYQEKNIALSLTCREKIRVTENWAPALRALLQG